MYFSNYSEERLALVDKGQRAKPLKPHLVRVLVYFFLPSYSLLHRLWVVWAHKPSCGKSGKFQMCQHKTTLGSAIHDAPWTRPPYKWLLHRFPHKVHILLFCSPPPMCRKSLFAADLKAIKMLGLQQTGYTHIRVCVYVCPVRYLVNIFIIKPIFKRINRYLLGCGPDMDFKQDNCDPLIKQMFS